MHIHVINFLAELVEILESRTNYFSNNFFPLDSIKKKIAKLKSEIQTNSKVDQKQLIRLRRKLDRIKQEIVAYIYDPTLFKETKHKDQYKIAPNYSVKCQFAETVKNFLEKLNNFLPALEKIKFDADLNDDLDLVANDKSLAIVELNSAKRNLLQDLIRLIEEAHTALKEFLSKENIVEKFELSNSCRHMFSDSYEYQGPLGLSAIAFINWISQNFVKDRHLFVFSSTELKTGIDKLRHVDAEIELVVNSMETANFYRKPAILNQLILAYRTFVIKKCEQFSEQKYLIEKKRFSQNLNRSKPILMPTSVILDKINNALAEQDFNADNFITALQTEYILDHVLEEVLTKNNQSPNEARQFILEQLLNWSLARKINTLDVASKLFSAGENVVSEFKELIAHVLCRCLQALIVTNHAEYAYIKSKASSALSFYSKPYSDGNKQKIGNVYYPKGSLKTILDIFQDLVSKQKTLVKQEAVLNMFGQALIKIKQELVQKIDVINETIHQSQHKKNTKSQHPEKPLRKFYQYLLNCITCVDDILKVLQEDAIPEASVNNNSLRAG